MKRLGVKAELCVGCRLCEEKCSEAWKKVNDREKSNIRIDEDGEKGYKISVCNQCGNCIKYCPTQAIYRDKHGIVRIKKDLCVGCLICVGNCPTDTMYYHDEDTEPFKCIACGLCAKECPSGAIEIEEV